jgi:hypothetical protein
MKKEVKNAKEGSPVRRVEIPGKRNLTGSGLKRKQALNKVIELDVPKAHGHPRQRVIKTTIHDKPKITPKRHWLKSKGRTEVKSKVTNSSKKEGSIRQR